MTASSTALRDVAAPLLHEAGLELWDVEIGRDVVRFLVDRPWQPSSSEVTEPAPESSPSEEAPPAGADHPPAGVDLDDLSVASQILSAVVDDRDDLVPAGQYQLEVSSPGVERTLRTPEQYRRYVGTLVSIKTTFPVDGSRRFRGILTAVNDDSFSFTPDEGAGGETRSLRYDQVDRTRTVLVWGPAAGAKGPRSGRPKAPKRQPAGSTSGGPNRKDPS